MFGRRRRNARLIQAQTPQPVPALTDERVFELLHSSLSELIGVGGDWTLVPRQAEDTDDIFHDLKSQQIASLLTKQLAEARDATTDGAAATENASADAATTAEPVEPTALPWSPVPISVWAEPERAVPESAVPESAEQEHRTRLVA